MSVSGDCKSKSIIHIELEVLKNQVASSYLTMEIFKLEEDINF